MDQTTINWILGGASALFGALFNIIWASIRDLQKVKIERSLGLVRSRF
jgi:hypothetical protein